MTDPYQQRDQAYGLEQTRTIERSPLYLPLSQRILNPFPLASSGLSWGDMPQPWSVNVLVYTITVYVVTTNNATNYWTIELRDALGVTLLATLNTSAIAANTSTRLSTTTITQPAGANTWLTIIPTATLAPGAIYIWPAVALLRTGN